MNAREELEKVLNTLPEDRLVEILDFAEYISWRQEREAWQQFGKAQFARAYGTDEPDYTSADIKSEANT